jgi:YtoQ family protein
MINIYLSGEIHSSWRDDIINLCKDANLDINFTSPELVHDKSDNIALNILGTQGDNFHNDNASSKINSIKTHTAIQKSDLVIAKFTDQYKQWNTAFEVGFAYANHKKIIVLYPEQFTHALKEINSVASVCVHTNGQVIEVLKYLYSNQENI